jgi:hypothetical protein
MTEDMQSSSHDDDASLSSTSYSAHRAVFDIVSQEEQPTASSTMILDDAGGPNGTNQDQKKRFFSSFAMFRMQYLIVHTAIMLADGLQGMFLFVFLFKTSLIGMHDANLIFWNVFFACMCLIINIHHRNTFIRSL